VILFRIRNLRFWHETTGLRPRSRKLGSWHICEAGPAASQCVHDYRDLPRRVSFVLKVTPPPHILLHLHHRWRPGIRRVGFKVGGGTYIHPHAYIRSTGARRASSRKKVFVSSRWGLFLFSPGGVPGQFPSKAFPFFVPRDVGAKNTFLHGFPRFHAECSFRKVFCEENIWRRKMFFARIPVKFCKIFSGKFWKISRNFTKKSHIFYFIATSGPSRRGGAVSRGSAPGLRGV